jgi:hypothetical protein
MKLSVSIISVYRPQNYIDKTIKCLSKECSEIYVFVGNRNHSYLDGYIVKKEIAKDYSEIDSLPLYKKAVWNYKRSLRHDIGEDYSMICEDDIILSNGWLGEVEKRVQETGILTLYVPHESEAGKLVFDFPLKAYKEGKTLAEYPRGKFYGSQCIVYSRKIKEQLSQYFEEKFLLPKCAPIDYLIRDFALERDVRIFSTAPCLAQHIGDKTTGLQGKSHKSISFVE